MPLSIGRCVALQTASNTQSCTHLKSNFRNAPQIQHTRVNLQGQFPSKIRSQRSTPFSRVTRSQAADLAAPLNNGSTSIAIPNHSYFQLTSPYDKEIFKLAIPALFSTLLDPLMGMVDTAIVGRLGTEPLAAVGLSTVLYNFSNFIWNFLLYTTTPRIAAAVSRNDPAGVSKIASQGLWVAAAIGCTMTAILWTNCPAMFTAMGGSPAVLEHAVPYLRGRCIASPAIMMFYVMAGTFRGFQDTLTPLTAGIVSNIFHLFLDIALVFWLGWGVTGAALATSLSHWVTILILGGIVVSRGHLKLKDLATPPTWNDVSPVLRNGVLLSTRSILAMSMLMWATKLIAGFGAVALASHEILRQIWVFSNQAFTSLDIATQSLIAFYLGRNDKQSAADVFRRTLSLTSTVAVFIMFALLASQHSLPAIFSRDAAVIAQVSRIMPLISFFMPLDAMASVMDGVLLGSQEASWMSRTMIATSACCGIGLMTCQNMGYGIFIVWSVIKFLTVGRLIGNAWRLWSPKSPLGQYIWTGSVSMSSSSVEDDVLSSSESVDEDVAVKTTASVNE